MQDLVSLVALDAIPTLKYVVTLWTELSCSIGFDRYLYGLIICKWLSDQQKMQS